jgi:hypothetical protein
MRVWDQQTCGVGENRMEHVFSVLRAEGFFSSELVAHLQARRRKILQRIQAWGFKSG